MLPNIGAPELIIILIVALIVVGPGKLPDVGSALGKSIREFRKAATDVKESTSLEPAQAAVPAPAAPVAAAPAVSASSSVVSAPPTPVLAPPAPPVAVAAVDGEADARDASAAADDATISNA